MQTALENSHTEFRSKILS